MFHLHYKPLWAVIEDADSRFRKRATPGRMIERVMLLDAVLDDRSQTWIGPGADKRRFFMRALGDTLPWQQFPRIRFGAGAEATYRYFPDKLPIGIHPEFGDRPVFLYLVNRPSPWDFRLFLLRHVALLEALSHWTIRLLFPKPLVKARHAYLNAAREHLATPLQVRRDVVDQVFRERGQARRLPALHRCPSRLSRRRSTARDSERSTSSGSSTPSAPSSRRNRAASPSHSNAGPATSSAST